MMRKEWALAPATPAEQLEAFRGLSPILAQIMRNRGFEDPAAADSFLRDLDLNDDPFLLRDMARAVERVEAAITTGERMAVYGDFDADGVCATALLIQVLRALGGKAQPYIPDRADEGYGLNAPALRKLAEAGFTLVITVDCGIRSVDEVAAGMRAGLDIIVSDHHSIGEELPAALAVINPQREDCPGDGRLAGVGVAFMLAKALLQSRWRTDRGDYPPGLRLSDLLDLVALGTVADVVPLKASLNRRFARHGLRVINEMRRPGIAALARVAGLREGEIKASHIGFGLGPRLNAAGRLGSAMVAYELLLAPTQEEALPLAQALQALNRERQRQTRQAQATIGEQVAEERGSALIFAGDETIAPGIVGLVAGRLAEEFYRPAVVLEIGDELSRGSCRSIPEFNITRALDACADLLLRHGGHAMAAGFTVANDNLDALRRQLGQMARESLDGRELLPRLPIDMEIRLEDISQDLIAELDRLEPTGHGNEPPTFMIRGLRALRSRRVGNDGAHLKLQLQSAGGARIEAIGFGLGAWGRRMPKRIDVACQLEINEWNGQRSLELRLLDIRPAQPPRTH